MAKAVKMEPVEVTRTKLHVLQLWFGWAVVIMALLSIFFINGNFSVHIDTINIPILLLGLLEVVSGRRR